MMFCYVTSDNSCIIYIHILIIENCSARMAFCLQTALSDYCGYMLLGDASLAALNQRLTNPVPISNFRANIIVDGCPAFEEVGSF